MKHREVVIATQRIGLLMMVVGLLTACGGSPAQPGTTPADAPETPSDTATTALDKVAAGGQTADFPFTIENCGATFTYTAIPQRALVFDGNMINMMVQLGLQDRVVGYWTSGAELDPDTKAQLANATEITANMPGPSREVVLEQSPDFIFGGWEGYGFSEESGLTQAALTELQINSYALSESCQDANGITTIDDTYTDITNIGRIFGVLDRGQQVIVDMQADIASVTERLDASATPPRVFVYDDIGADNPLTVGSSALLNHLITLAGGANIFNDLAEDWSTVGWESVIERNPDIIVVMDTDWESATERMARLKSLPQLAELPAIKNERFVTIHYRQAVSGLQNAEGVRLLAQGLHPDKFQ
ncbi:MAG: ABC transporter substrate-binding protein [Chloroflexales bacterium]|nr:ABC transporter substrate-binding protein [Chloroflexales bacterium]